MEKTEQVRNNDAPSADAFRSTASPPLRFFHFLSHCQTLVGKEGTKTWYQIFMNNKVSSTKKANLRGVFCTKSA